MSAAVPSSGRHAVARALFGACVFLVTSIGSAQPPAAGGYPERPVRWIVPFPVGGSVDLIARVLGPKLFEEWGEQLVVDNRPGAGGRLGTHLAAAATPDGYVQLLTLSTNLTADRSLFRKLPYDPQRAFVPITITAAASQLLVVNPRFPAQDVRELIAQCKARPGKINYGSSGIGGSLHLAMELFKSTAGIDVVHVAYKGGPPAATDLMAGQISLMFFNTPAALPYLRTGKLRALGVSTATRSPLLPDVPAIAESLPGFDTEVWYGLVAPAGTSDAVVQSTYASVAKALAMPEVRKALQDIGAEPGGVPPEQFAQQVKSETRQWAAVIRNANIHLD